MSRFCKYALQIVRSLCIHPLLSFNNNNFKELLFDIILKIRRYDKRCIEYCYSMCIMGNHVIKYFYI